jgi:hypothetical protein
MVLYVGIEYLSQLQDIAKKYCKAEGNNTPTG